MSIKKSINFLFLIVLSAFLLCCSHYPSYEQIVEIRSKIEPITFEKQKWFDKKDFGVEALWEDRPGLARDLISKNLLIGKSFAEIQDLLGEQGLDKTTNSVSYQTYVEMGVADPIFIENLVVKFDESNKVEKAEIKIVMMDGHPDYR